MVYTRAKSSVLSRVDSLLFNMELTGKKNVFCSEIKGSGLSN